MPPSKFLKEGKVVIILNGRFAGRKAVILRTYEDGAKDRKFGHALVAGLERPPRKVTRAMSEKKQEKRLRVKPFVKFINFNHIMPTRYNLDISEVAAIVKDETLVDEDKKKVAKTEVTKKLTESYKKIGQIKNEKVATGALYFYRKLKF